MAENIQLLIDQAVQKAIADFQAKLDAEKDDELTKNLRMVTIASGSSHPELAKAIANNLGTELDNVELRKFANSETNIRYKSTQRNRKVFIVQTGGFVNQVRLAEKIAKSGGDTTKILELISTMRGVDDYLMELSQMFRAVVLSGGEEITAIIPFLPYSRSDKREQKERSAIAARLVCDMLEKAGSGKLVRIITLDLHAGQEVGFTSHAVFDNLYAINLFIDYLDNNLFKGLSLKEIQQNFAFCSPDAGGEKRTKAWAEAYNMDGFVCTKTRPEAGKVGKIKFCGDKEMVSGKTVILPDDMIDSGGTMIETARVLVNDYGAKNVVLAATHGLFTGKALKNINECNAIIKVIVVNTLPQDENQKECDKLVVLDCSQLIAHVLKIKLNDTGDRERASVSNLFNVKKWTERLT